MDQTTRRANSTPDMIGLPSRRDVMTALASLGLGLGVLRMPGAVARKRQRTGKKRPKKAKPNAYGCLNMRQPCQGNSALCCSGICEGKKPKKGKRDKSRCVAHDAATCKVDFDFCTAGVKHLCNATNEQCACVLTTGNAPFCGNFVGSYCRECARDADCEADLGPGAACVVLKGICAPFCDEASHTACFPPCVDTGPDM